VDWLALSGRSLVQERPSGLHDPDPDRPPFHVSFLGQLIGPHGGVNGRILAVSLDEQFGGAVEAGQSKRGRC
jgi:hypothetical protein